MSRNLKIAFVVLAAAVVIGALSLSGLFRRIQRLAQSQFVEERARQELLSKPISTPTDVNVKAKMFWAAGEGNAAGAADASSAGGVAPTEIDLPLSADPVQRCRQLIQALIASPPTLGQRTLPADTTLLGFYILPDGTAIADFSDTIASEMPSGILSEQIAVNSLAQTLVANVSGLRRLKILIHGQEVDTLAGHLDLTGSFDLVPAAIPSSVSAAAVTSPAASVPPPTSPAPSH